MVFLCSRAQCLTFLRARVGDLLFLHVASYVPASCQLGLTDSEQGRIAELLRESMREQHWLASYVECPHVSMKVSGHVLAEAIASRMNRRVPLDADGVFALSALCNFATTAATRVSFATTSATQASISEDDDQEVELWDSNSDGGASDEFELPDTPLTAALGIEDQAIVRLLLHRNADPNGYQRHRFNHEDGEPYERISPLHLAILHYRPDFVDMLLQARADPNECGYELDLHGEAVHPDGGHHSDCENPLWRAVDQACRRDPLSQQGVAARLILQSLLFYGAHADGIGKAESRGPCDRCSDVSTDSDFSVDAVDAIGYLQTSRSRVTPLGLALAHSAREHADEVQSFDPQWSTDIVYMLLAPGSEKPSPSDS